MIRTQLSEVPMMRSQLPVATVFRRVRAVDAPRVASRLDARRFTLLDAGMLALIIAAGALPFIFYQRGDSFYSGDMSYLELARYMGVSIEHVLETHNHADHVSGHGRLAATTGATIHIHRLAEPAYEHEPFVEVVGAPPGTREVQGTNFCRVFAKADPHSGKVVVLSAIDNLWKGTSSQAVQNLNVMFGFDETEGLT